MRRADIEEIYNHNDLNSHYPLLLEENDHLPLLGYKRSG